MVRPSLPTIEVDEVQKPSLFKPKQTLSRNSSDDMILSKRKLQFETPPTQPAKPLVPRKPVNENTSSSDDITSPGSGNPPRSLS